MGRNMRSIVRAGIHQGGTGHKHSAEVPGAGVPAAQARKRAVRLPFQHPVTPRRGFVPDDHRRCSSPIVTSYVM